MKIIDGREINRRIGQELQQEISNTGAQSLFTIMCVGEDRASLSFINVKKNFGKRYGFGDVHIVNSDEQTTTEAIKEALRNIQINNHAVILQLPLPEKFKKDTEDILSVIQPVKDVDNLTGKSSYLSPIVLALQEVLPEKFKKIAIVGMGKVVGIPLAEYCAKLGYDFVTVKEGEMSKIKDCDVIISAVGIPHVIKKEFIMPGATLIDYGCSYLGDQLCGDFAPECYDIAGNYTPVPGGMGPIVVACLFKNVLKSYC